MKYEKCLTCNQLGVTCDGPNLLLLDTVELGQWCNELRKLRPGMTYDKTALETGVSKTAVYNFLTGGHPDCRLETVRPVARLYIGGNSTDNPCGNVSNSEKAAYEDKIAHFESEIRWRDERIQHLTNNYNSMTTLIANTNNRTAADKDFLRGQIKSKNKVIIVLATLLGITVALIIAALIFDWTNPDVGFFWLRSWLGGEGATKVISKLIP